MKRYILLIIFLFTKPVFSKEVLSVDIYIENNRFRPDKITVPSTQPIKLIIHNLDKTPEEFESQDLKREKLVPAESEVVIRLPVLEAGKEYRFFGEFHPETAQGVLVVE